jgi:hypothetical protein
MWSFYDSVRSQSCFENQDWTAMFIEEKGYSQRVKDVEEYRLKKASLPSTRSTVKETEFSRQGKS